MNRKVVNAAKALTTTAAVAVTGDPVATVGAAIGASLLIAIDSLSDLSTKRAIELFDTPEFTERVVEEVKKSDDFASLVFDLWRRYNFESSELRRKMLKSILDKATYEEQRNYENFSKIFLVAEQITNSELILLAAFYLPDAHTYSDTGMYNEDDFQLNLQEVQRLFNDKKIDFPIADELADALTQLGNYGLISERAAALGGPFYKQRRFGRLFLDYIHGDEGNAAS